MEIMNEVERLYDSYDGNYDYFEKGYIWYLLEYLHQIMPTNKKIGNMYNDINIRVNMPPYDVINTNHRVKEEMSKYLEKNKTFFKEKLSSPKNVSIPFYDNLLELPEKNLFYILCEFLKEVDNDLYYFYCKMLDERRVLNFGYKNCTMHTSLDSSETMILINNYKTLHDLLSLSHEIGHAYFIYHNNQKVIDRKNTLMAIKDEIPSMIMEKRFIEFLHGNMVSPIADMFQKEFDFSMHISNLRQNEYGHIKYLIGANIATKLDKNINITDYFEHVYKTDIHNLLKEVDDEKTKGKVLVK